MGPGGIYFAQSNRAGHKVKHVTLEPFRINTVEDAASHTDAREQAKALARSSPSQAARADQQETSRHHATKKKSPALATNASGLTLAQWIHSAAFAQGHGLGPGDFSEARRDWEADVDPAEWGHPRRPSKGHHATKKSPAQLQREIDEVLAKPLTTSSQIRLPPGEAAAWAHRHLSKANTPNELAEMWRAMKKPGTGMGAYYASRTGIAQSEINAVYQQHRARLGAD